MEWEEVKAWRKAERARLIAARLAVPAAERERIAKEIAVRLDALVRPAAGMVISLYWPFRGELDLRPWARDAIDRGARIALPVVVEKAAPLEFRAWHPGAAMERGVWNIPVPSAEAERVVPDVVIAPLVGFDTDSYRLGYGGGYYDRTLAALASRPLVIGVGLALMAVPTIHPRDHDIAMDRIVTEAR